MVIDKGLYKFETVYKIYSECLQNRFRRYSIEKHITFGSCLYYRILSLRASAAAEWISKWLHSKLRSAFFFLFCQETKRTKMTDEDDLRTISKPVDWSVEQSHQYGQLILQIYHPLFPYSSFNKNRMFVTPVGARSVGIRYRGTTWAKLDVFAEN